MSGAARKAAFLAALYAAVAIMTFGHSAARNSPNAIYKPRDIIVCEALFAGVMWPLYWSWQAWDQRPLQVRP